MIDGKSDMSGLFTRFLIRFSTFILWLPLTVLPDMSSVKGPRSSWARILRFRVSLLLGEVGHDLGPRDITEQERVGSMKIQPESFEMLLWRKGFSRNFLSRLKMNDGWPDEGSYVFRKSPMAPRQLHIVFWSSGEEVEIYAHEEYSSINPLYVVKHLRKEGQDPEAGKEKAEEILPKTVKLQDS